MDLKILVVVAAALFLLLTPAPMVSTITPDHGLNNTTVSVTINGEKFFENVTVKLVKPDEPDLIASDVKVLSKTQLTCSFNLKDKAVGKWNLVVSNKDLITKQNKSVTFANAFIIEYPAPAVTGIEPKKGINNARIAITNLAGANFRSEASVMLTSNQMDIGASKINVISDAKITCEFDLNGVTPGVYSIKVVNNDGKTGNLAEAFTVTGPPAPVVIRPAINSITPNRGFNNGFVLTDITGTNFEPEASVKLIGPGLIEVPGLNVKIEAGSKINCFFDIKDKPTGQYDLVVTDPSGQKATLAAGFTVEVYVPSANEINKALKPVFFDLNQDNLKPNQSPALENDLKIVKANPNLFILLGGHADERGKQSYNLDLSRRRAQNIKQYLIENGINPARIIIYAYGEENPIKKGHDESAWSLNRRVDIIVGEAPLSKEQGLSMR